MEYLISFIIVFLLVYLFYFLFVIIRKNKLSKIKNSTEVLFLKKRYNLKLENISNKSLANYVALVNAFIIAITFIFIELIENYILKIMVAFVILIILILIMYTILGKQLKKKEGK